MKLIRKSNDLFYITIPIDYENEDKSIIIAKVKSLFLNYNKKYNLLEPGFYEISIYFHKLYGTILIVKQIDSFEFSTDIDLKIIIKDKIKLMLELTDPLEFKDYKDKIDIDTLDEKNFLKLIEHSTLLIENKKALY